MEILNVNETASFNFLTQSSKRKAKSHSVKFKALNFELWFYALRFTLFAILVSLYFSIYPAAQAADYYVDAGIGNDANPGTSGQPWKTLSKAGNTASAGDVVLVKVGTYNETLVIQNDGQPGNPITFQAYPGEQPVIDGELSRRGIVLDNRKNIVINGFKIINMGSSTAYGIQMDNTENIVISNNYIEGPDSRDAGCIKFSGTLKNITIDRNILYFTDDGITGYAPSTGNYEDFLICNNTIVGKALYGPDSHPDSIEIEGNINRMKIVNNIIGEGRSANVYITSTDSMHTLQDIIISGNLIFQKASSGISKQIHFDTRFPGTVVNNLTIESNSIITYGNGVYQHGISIGDCVASNIKIRNNLLYDSILFRRDFYDSDYNLFYKSPDNTKAMIVQNNVHYSSLSAFRFAYQNSELHSIQADPLFIDLDKDNFHLSLDSLAVNAGDDVLNSSKDLDCNNRPSDGKYDIGAYEYFAGNIYYVDTTNGNDNNVGSREYPWKTINKACKSAQAGDMVLIKAGIYHETLQPVNSGSVGKPIIFKALPQDACKGDFSCTKSDCQVVLDGEGVINTGVYLYPKDYIRVEGFEIRNFKSEPVIIQTYYNSGVEGIEIVNNYIHDNGGYQAISAMNLVNCLIENNEIYKNNGSAIAIGGVNGVDGLIIRANNIHYNTQDGIVGKGKNIIIEYNKMYDQCHTDTHQDGLQIGDLRDSIIRNNLICDFTQNIYLATPSDVTDNVYENIEISGNVIYTDKYYTLHGGEAPGIFLSPQAAGKRTTYSNIRIHSNTFGWTGYAGIRFYPFSDTIVGDIYINNNIFYDSGISMTPFDKGKIHSDYNLFCQSTPWQEEGAHSMIGYDPKFVDYRRHEAWDFHLQPDSSAKDKGDPALESEVDFKDIDGNPRPLGDGLDIGAYEYKEAGVIVDIIYGDVSGDSVLSAYDAALAARIAVGLDAYPTGDNLTKADVSGDGFVTAYDAALIAQKAVGLIVKFPVES
jgi:hypothetical protein